MSSESLTVILAVGLIAGWLAGQIVHGTGYGTINDLIIGVVGSFIGGSFLPQPIADSLAAPRRDVRF